MIKGIKLRQSCQDLSLSVYDYVEIGSRSPSHLVMKISRCSVSIMRVTGEIVLHVVEVFTGGEEDNIGRVITRGR